MYFATLGWAAGTWAWLVPRFPVMFFPYGLFTGSFFLAQLSIIIYLALLHNDGDYRRNLEETILLHMTFMF